MTSIEMENLKLRIHNSSIEADIGITFDSITLFSSSCRLNSLNMQFPERLRMDDDKMTECLLRSIKVERSAHLASEAIEELHAKPNKRLFQNNKTGKRVISGLLFKV